jgi:hypothetical protein
MLGHPSVVSCDRALAALGLPESPSPHPSGCDPDEACACGLSQSASPWLEDASKARAPSSLPVVPASRVMRVEVTPSS